MLNDANSARPLDNAEVDHLFAPLSAASHVLLAVSGGPDSVALMCLVSGWRARLAAPRPQISVATVDHGLRPDSAEEAAIVGRWARALGLAHTVLPWTGEKPQTGLQEAARAARYDLLLTHADMMGADRLVTAHHADDQAETILLRLCAGSGLAGLAGMAVETDRQGISLIRPFLSIPGERLKATILASGHPSFDDPSNHNPRFGRARLRAAKEVLAREGLDTTRLLRLATRAKRANDALDFFADEIEERVRLPDAHGTRLAPELLSHPEEMIIRLINRAVCRHGTVENVRLHRLEQIVAELVRAFQTEQICRYSIAGTLVSLKKNGIITITTAPPRRKNARDMKASAALSLGKGAIDA